MAGLLDLLWVESGALLGCLAGITYLGLARFREGRAKADFPRHLQQILDGVSESVAIVGTDRTVLSANSAHVALFGVTQNKSLDELRRMFEVRRIGGDLVPSDEWPAAQALSGKHQDHAEYEIVNRELNRDVFVQVSTAPIKDHLGKPLGIIVAYKDITGHKSAQQARELLAAIVHSSGDAIIGKDLDGIVTSWNAGATKIFGYTADEMLGQSVRVLVPEDQQSEEDEILERTRAGETIDHLETIRRTKSGKFIHVSLTISPIRDEAGNITGASKIARNISDRKSLEDQLHQAQKMDAIGQLTGGIAHDFNNLLCIVLGNLDLLERSLEDSGTPKKLLERAQKATLRGADLARRLLAFSSSAVLEPAPIAVERCIMNTLELATRALGPEIAIRTVFSAPTPLIIADASGLEIALVNLLVNARDAMPRGGTITISTDVVSVHEGDPVCLRGELKPGGYVHVSVSDTGQGMSREVQDRAFEPFFTTKERGKGTGLGLPMVYGFFKQSHGTVRIYSELRYGTTVSFYLPIAGNRASEPELEAPPRFCTMGSHTVLVVDDETELAEIAASYLTDAGYAVLCAPESASALLMLRQHPAIDLMLTDVVMPGQMNGVELGERARQLKPELQVIYCSGYPADHFADQPIQPRGPYLRKPYDRGSLISMVRRVLDGETTAPKPASPLP